MSADVDKREEWMMDLGHLDHLHREDLKQECWMKCVVEGDENTRFFHFILKNKHINSLIKSIHIKGVWHESQEETKNTTYDHFS